MFDCIRQFGFLLLLPWQVTYINQPSSSYVANLIIHQFYCQEINVVPATQRSNARMQAATEEKKQIELLESAILSRFPRQKLKGAVIFANHNVRVHY